MDKGAASLWLIQEWLASHEDEIGAKSALALEEFNGTMMPYFHWYGEAGGLQWRRLQEAVPELAKASITGRECGCPPPRTAAAHRMWAMASMTCLFWGRSTRRDLKPASTAPERRSRPAMPPASEPMRPRCSTTGCGRMPRKPMQQPPIRPGQPQPCPGGETTDPSLDPVPLRAAAGPRLDYAMALESH